MGLFGDLRRLNQQARAIDATYDPAAQMRAGMAQMQQAQHSMQAQTADLELEQTGTPGAATILGLVGHRHADQHGAAGALNLLVEHAGKPPYPVTVETMLPLHASAQAGIGQRVSVKVDPYRAERVLVRWGLPV